MPKFKSLSQPNTNKLNWLDGSFEIDSISEIDDSYNTTFSPLKTNDLSPAGSNVAETASPVTVAFYNSPSVAGSKTISTRNVNNIVNNIDFDIELNFTFEKASTTDDYPILQVKMLDSLDATIYGFDFEPLKGGSLEDFSRISLKDCDLTVIASSLASFSNKNYIRISRIVDDNGDCFINAMFFDPSLKTFVGILPFPEYFPDANTVKKIEITLSGQSNDESDIGSGKYTINNLKYYPVFKTYNCIDNSPLGVPVCTGYTNNSASFNARPMTVGSFSLSKITGIGTKEIVTEYPLPYEVVSYNNTDSDLHLITSKVDVLSTTAVFPNLCPVMGESGIDNKGDSEVLNVCFDDGSDLDTNPVDIIISSSGSFNENSTEKDNFGFHLKDQNDFIYGKDEDARLISNVSLFTPITEYPNPGDGKIRICRTLELKNKSKVFYGVHSPVYSEAVVRITCTYGSGNGLITLYKDGKPDSLFSWNSTTPTYRFKLCHGSYRLQINNSNNLGVVCKIELSYDNEVTWQTVQEATYYSMTNFVSTGYTSVRAAFAYFEVKPYRGYLFAYFQTADGTTVLREAFAATAGLQQPVSLYSDSIGAFEDHEGNTFLVFQEALPEGDFDAYNPVSWNRTILKYIKFDPSFTEVSDGYIQPSGSGSYNYTSNVLAFDCCVLDDQFYLYYSIQESNAPRDNSRNRYGPSGDNAREFIIVDSCAVSAVETSSNYKKFTKRISEIQVRSWQVIFDNKNVSDSPNLLDFPPTPGRFNNFKPGAAFIKCLPCEYQNKIVLSVISQHTRIPAILMGKDSFYKEVAIPTFFDFYYQEDKYLGGHQPVVYIESALHVDGFIHSIATTQTNEHPKNFLNPTNRAQVITTEKSMFDTSFYYSPGQSFLEFNIGNEWCGFENIKAHNSGYRTENVPVFNSFLNNFRHDYERSSGLSGGSYTVLQSNVLEATFEMQACVSIFSLENSLVYGVSCPALNLPKIYKAQDYSRFPFSTQLTQNLNLYPSPALTSGAASIDPVDYSILIPTSSASAYIDYIDSPYLSRQQPYNLQNGIRAKWLFDTFNIVNNGAEFRFEIFSSHTTLGSREAKMRTVLRRTSGNIFVDFQVYSSPAIPSFSYTYVTVDTVQLLSNSYYTLNMATMLDSFRSITARYMFCINKEDLTSGLPSEYISHTSVGNYKVVNDEGVQEVRVSVESLSNGLADSITVYDIQSGTILTDIGIREPFEVIPAGEEDHLDIVYASNPTVGLSKYPRSDVDIFNKPVDNLNSNKFSYNIGPLGESGTFHYYNGFSFNFLGSSFKTKDTWRLERKAFADINEVTSSRLHGELAFSFKSNYFNGIPQDVYIYADANLNNSEKFTVNSLMLKGINFPQFSIVVKDTPEEEWETVRTVNISEYAYRLDQVAVNFLSDECSFVVNSSTRLPPGKFYNEKAYVVQCRNLGTDLDVNRYFKLVSTNNSQIEILPRDQDSLSDKNLLYIYGDKMYVKLPVLNFRFVGIKITSANYNQDGEQAFLNSEFFGTINSIDFGYSSKFPFDFPYSSTSGTSINFDSQGVLVSNNQFLSTAYRNESKTFTIDYNIQEAKTFVKLKSIVDKTGLSYKPVWIIENIKDPYNPILAFVTSPPEYSVILDDDGDKYYEIRLTLESVDD